jgi:tetratricopeptide (TPR) repeat protein
MCLPLLINDPDHAYAKLILCGESDELLVIFGSRNRKKFELFKALEGLKVNKLFLIDRFGDAWYQTGVPQFGESLSEIAENISLLAKKHSIKSIYCFGASMGGYAAVAIGAMLNVQKVVAVSPQIKLNKGWPLTPPTQYAVEFSDLSPLIAGASTTYFSIITSSELLDVYHACQIFHLKNVNVCIVSSSHNVLANIKYCDAIDDFLKFTICNNNIWPAINSLSIDCEFIEPFLANYLSSLYIKNYSLAIGSMKRIILKNPSWFEAMRGLALCHYQLREFDKALPIFINLKVANSSECAVFPQLISIFAAKGLFDHAEMLLAEFLVLANFDSKSLVHALASVAKCCFFTKAFHFSAKLRKRIMCECNHKNIDNFYALGRSYYYAGDYVLAVKIFEEISQMKDLDNKVAWMVERSIFHLKSIRSKSDFIK